MAYVVKQLKRAPQCLSLACHCFIMTGLDESIPVELHWGFIGSNLAMGRSLIFGWMFFNLSLWQRIRLPTCFVIDLPFKIQYILVMFDRIYPDLRCPWLWYFLTISIVIWCLAGKITWCFHPYRIFANFCQPPTLIPSRHNDVVTTLLWRCYPTLLWRSHIVAMETSDSIAKSTSLQGLIKRVCNETSQQHHFCNVIWRFLCNYVATSEWRHMATS